PVRAAAELAVGHHLEADVLLQAHHVADRVVLDGVERLGVDLARGELAERVAQALRPQQAAHVIGTERRPAVSVHAQSPRSDSSWPGLTRPSRLGSHGLALLSGITGTTLAAYGGSPGDDKARGFARSGCSADRRTPGRWPQRRIPISATRTLDLPATRRTAGAGMAVWEDGEALRRMTAPRLLLDHARATPARIAFRAKRRGIYVERTYRDYAALVAQCALGLKALGLSPGDRVAIMGDPCEEWMIADLA